LLTYIKHALGEAASQRNSLRTRTLLSMWGIALFSILLVGFSSFISTRSFLNREIDIKIQRNFNAISNKIDAILIAHARIPAALARACETFGGLAGRDRYIDLQKRLLMINEDTFGVGVWFEPYRYRADLHYFGPYVYRKDGKIVLTEFYETSEYDYPSWNWYTIAKNTGRTVVFTDPYYDRHTDITMVTTSAPFYDAGGRFMGVATGDIDLTSIQRIISGISIGSTGRAFLLSSDGLFLADRDKSRVMKKKIASEKNASLALLGKEMISQRRGNGSYEAEDGRRRIYYTPLEETGWILGIDILENELVAPLRELMLIIFIIIVLALSATAFFGFKAANSISTPIVDLTGRVQRMAAEHLNHPGDAPPRHGPPLPGDTRGSNEIDMLAGNIDMLQMKLSQYIRERDAAETEVKRAEEKYRNIFENAVEGIFQITDDGSIVSANPSFITLFGAASFDELRGAFNLLDEKRHADKKTWREISDAVKNGTAVSGIETELRTLRHEGIWITLNFQPVAGEGGPRLSEGTATNITERKKLETQLRQAQKMEALGTLAGGIAHDFNNILTAILGNTELSLLEANDAELRARLEQTMTSSIRAKTLVKQILAFSRKQEQVKKTISLDNAIAEAVDLMRATIPATIEIRYTKGAESCVASADPVQMEQIVMNLCSNAAHAMHGKAGLIEVTLTKRDFSDQQPVPLPEMKPGFYAELMVKDNGTGIEPAVIQKIFDPFFTTKDIGEGTGLGLSVVYGIVKSYEGHVSVNSEPGAGTTFFIYLPCSSSSACEETEQAGDVPRGNERILYVDDEIMLGRMAEKILASLGYAVTVRSSGPEALDLFQTDPAAFDLVVTDNYMPKMTGIQLAAEIVKMRPDQRIMLCSGSDEMVSGNVTSRAGIGWFIMKPFFIGELARAVRAALDEDPGLRPFK
jgi:PAS domain S-box-containing protein